MRLLAPKAPAVGATRPSAITVMSPSVSVQGGGGLPQNRIPEIVDVAVADGQVGEQARMRPAAVTRTCHWVAPG